MSCHGSRLSGVLVLLVGVSSLACGSGELAPPVGKAGPSGVDTVVLVSIDTLRRDAVGFFAGREPSPTRFLDELAARGIAFVDAVAPVPLTGPSHWSMLTGRWPWHEGVRLNSFPPTARGTRTVAEHLRDAGWTTGGFVSCFVLDARFGFDHGFDRYDADLGGASPSLEVEYTSRAGRATVSRALEWIRDRAADEKVFLWVHLFEPHHPYARALPEFSGPQGDYLTDVHEADRQVAALDRGLTQAGRLRERSLWVVISDHGEGLGEHGEATHGLLLHGATTRIPLVIAGPGIGPGRDDYLASTPDLLPTVLGFLGLPADARDGVDLLARQRPADRSVPLESMFASMAYGLAPVKGLRTGRWLWEWSPNDRLWDVSGDPSEETDVAPDHPDEVDRLRERRSAFGFPALESGPVLDPQAIEKLQALGYAGSGVEPGAEVGIGDVRAFATEGFGWVIEIDELLNAGRYEEAEEGVRRFLDRYPQSPTMWFKAALISLGRNRLAEAEGRLRRALQLQPSYDDARLNLGNVLAIQGRLEEAEETYGRVLERDPTNLHALFNLAASLERQGDEVQAAVYWRKVIELHPEHPRTAIARQRLAAHGQAHGR